MDDLDILIEMREELARDYDQLYSSARHASEASVENIEGKLEKLRARIATLDNMIHQERVLTQQ